VGAGQLDVQDRRRSAGARLPRRSMM
jgi:hypothetical protein